MKTTLRIDIMVLALLIGICGGATFALFVIKGGIIAIVADLITSAIAGIATIVIKITMKIKERKLDGENHSANATI